MTDLQDPVQAARERLLKVEMQYPHALEGVASLYVWCRKTGMIGASVWKVLLFFGFLIGMWIATKEWLVDFIRSSVAK